MKPTVVQLLAQDRIWLDKEGRAWRLEEMTPRHRRNVLHWLELRAFGLAWSWFGIFTDAPDEVWAEAERSAADPGAWLDSQPLVVRLRRLNRPFGVTRERVLHTVRNMIQ